jgi:hypothetical protein
MVLISIAVKLIAEIEVIFKMTYTPGGFIGTKIAFLKPFTIVKIFRAIPSLNEGYY